MQRVDEVIRERLASERRADRPDRATTSSAPAASGCARGWCCCSPSALGFEGRERYELAAIVEFIHTATLLHDDVVDESALRRGRATANAMFGNAASVLVGDFLYSRAFQMMVVGQPHAGARGAGRRDQRHRRRRSPAADEHARPRPRGRRLPAGDPLQDGQAVRGQRAARRGAGRAPPATRGSLRRHTAARWAPHSSSSTTCSTTKATATSSARTSATTCAKASRRCRCWSRWSAAAPHERALIRHAIEHGEVARAAGRSWRSSRAPARSTRRAMRRRRRPTTRAARWRAAAFAGARALLELCVRSVHRSS